MTLTNTFYGYVYKTTNLLNGRIYIGQHKNHIYNPKYIGSGKILKYAIDKYGKDNFKNELICWCENIEELDLKEIFYIDLYSRFFDIYNIAKGGEGGNLLKFASKEKRDRTMKKMAATRKRRGIGVGSDNPMYRSGKKGIHPLLGSKMSQETKDKISNSLKGNIPWNKGVKKPSSKKILSYEERYLTNKCKTPVKVTNVKTGEVKYYESKSECEKYFDGVKYRLTQKKVLEGESLLFEKVSKKEYLTHRKEVMPYGTSQENQPL